MNETTLLIGFDTFEADEIERRLGAPTIANEMLPKLILDSGDLYAQVLGRTSLQRVERVVFHGIFEHDIDVLAALCLWGGPCFPNPMPMIDCRLRLPGLAKALQYTRFGGDKRGFASARSTYYATQERVAKWGNWHCGENKQRFTGTWDAQEHSLIEPFVVGEAVRVVIIDQPRQIKMAGPGWLKSVYAPGASYMRPDPDLVADTQAIQRGLGLDVLAVDYMLGADGPYLLEVNHIPSLTCLPGLWDDYLAVLSKWFDCPSTKLGAQGCLDTHQVTA